MNILFKPLCGAGLSAMIKRETHQQVQLFDRHGNENGEQRTHMYRLF